jgi:hypothetical protein
VHRGNSPRTPPVELGLVLRHRGEDDASSDLVAARRGEARVGVRQGDAGGLRDQDEDAGKAEVAHAQQVAGTRRRTASLARVRSGSRAPRGLQATRP